MPTPPVWSIALPEGTLSLILVAARHASLDSHYVLTFKHIPVAGPLGSVQAGLRYAEREWLPVGVTARIDG